MDKEVEGAWGSVLSNNQSLRFVLASSFTLRAATTHDEQF